MIQSSFYGLCNPGMDSDIGYNNLNQMLPMVPGTFCGYIPNVTGTMHGVGHLGPLEQDIVSIENKQSRKDRSFWRTMLNVVLIGTGFGLAVKYGKSIINKVKNLIKK